MAPRILTFSIAMGADYSLELCSIDSSVPTFSSYDKFFSDNVYSEDERNKGGETVQGNTVFQNLV